MLLMPNGTLSPAPAGSQPGSGKGRTPVGGMPQMMQAGPMKLEGQERRKLIKEIRDEIKPLCSQIADF